MRLLPQSLFGRLVLVLLSGLVLAQLTTGYINLTERNQLLYQAGGVRLAERIADIGKLLDSLPLAERRRVAAVFNTPPLTVSLDRVPITVSDDPEPTDLRLSMFTGVLRYALDGKLPATVIRRQGAPESAPWQNQSRPAAMAMMSRHMDGDNMNDYFQRGTFYTVQLKMRDDSLVTFDTFLSPQEKAIPMRLALTLLILLGSVIALSLVAVRWVTTPLSALAKAADELGADINRPPLAETGPLEVRRAAHAFNTMQQRLSRFIADRTRVLAAMSHDLKTPITRLRLRTEMLDDEALRGKFAKDLEEMEAMVTQTLDFMRDASSVEPLQRVDLMALLESLQIDYQDTGDSVEIEGGMTQPYSCRPLALKRCLTNIIDNAIHYGERASIQVEDSAACVVIRVLDVGPGLPHEQIELAFEPFFRGEASRNRATGGTGLGLGIARNIARAHGGELTLRNRSEGGLEARLTLPRTDAKHTSQSWQK